MEMCIMTAFLSNILIVMENFKIAFCYGENPVYDDIFCRRLLLAVISSIFSKSLVLD
jgi:hypothetical protein